MREITYERWSPLKGFLNVRSVVLAWPYEILRRVLQCSRLQSHAISAPSNIQLPRSESKGESCHGGARPKLMAVMILAVGVKVQPKPMEGDSAVQKNKIRGT